MFLLVAVQFLMTLVSISPQAAASLAVPPAACKTNVITNVTRKHRARCKNTEARGVALSLSNETGLVMTGRRHVSHTHCHTYTYACKHTLIPCRAEATALGTSDVYVHGHKANLHLYEYVWPSACIHCITRSAFERNVSGPASTAATYQTIASLSCSRSSPSLAKHTC